jgi:asparagine synthase (glutamine-hydrolysing)
MCGIFAYFGNENLNSKIILAALHHRGPDSQGNWQATVGSKQIHLLHTRLAILDLSPTGNQPMVDESTGNVLVFNGEIYNFLELRQELKSLGLKFNSHSDTEVLLLGYRVWGEKLLERLDGMFAFLLFDQRQQRLLIARDHIGIKPLYYAQTLGGGIAFSSEVRALIRSGLVPTNWDEQSIYDYLVYGSVQEPRTIRRTIKAFPPAHYAYIDLQEDSLISPNSTCYWNLANYAGKLSEVSESQTIHAEVLQRTLQEQLVADVPISLFLSAGIDSTALASLLAPMSNGKLSAFTFDLQDSAKDESQLASETAQQLQLKHYVANLSQKTLNSWLLDSFAAMDQPSSDGTNTYLISRASSLHDIIVTISGCGADELHGGYPHFSTLVQLYQVKQKLGRMQPLFLPWIEKVKGLRKNSIYRERLKLLIEQIDSPFRMTHEIRRFLTPNQIYSICPQSQDFYVKTKDWENETNNNSNLDIETQISLCEIQSYLRNTLLRDSDWATMANQQELRVPYLGKRYMETVMGISWNHKRTTKITKKPLLATHVPPNLQKIVQRKKTGFDLDYALYLRTCLRDNMYSAFDYLNQSYGFQLNPKQVEEDMKMGDPAKQARRYWALTSLGIYLQQHS